MTATGTTSSGGESYAEPTDLAELYSAIEQGWFPPTDGDVRIVPPPSEHTGVVAAFTGHTVVAAAVDLAWVAARIPAGDLSAPMNPPFLSALCDRLDRRINALDMVALAAPLDGPPALALEEITDSDHPRVRRARRYRDDVRVWSVPGGLLVLGRGVAGRWEVAFETEPAHRGHGLGRALAASARHLVPADRAVWAQVTPGNAASVRALLGAGYQPIGSEALLTVRR